MTKRQNACRSECRPGKEAQQAFTCAPESVSATFKGKDVGVFLDASNLVGIDVDCIEAAKFLQKFLPPTCVVGRKSKATSWMFYRLKNGTIAKNVSFRDCGQSGQAGAELGGVKVNAAVALPPSKHRKTVEMLTWTCEREPADVHAQSFMVAVSKCFAMALIARHWPGPGNRHEPTLALAGTVGILVAKVGLEQLPNSIWRKLLGRRDERK